MPSVLLYPGLSQSPLAYILLGSLYSPYSSSPFMAQSFV